MTPDELDKMIPDEVMEAYLAALYGEPGLPHRKAIAAGLTAWPVQFADVDAKGRDVLMLVFPLSQEARDGE